MRAFENTPIAPFLIWNPEIEAFFREGHDGPVFSSVNDDLVAASAP
jgi:hypothetical protein